MICQTEMNVNAYVNEKVEVFFFVVGNDKYLTWERTREE